MFIVFIVYTQTFLGTWRQVNCCNAVFTWMDGWMDKWMDGWKERREGIRQVSRYQDQTEKV